MIFCDFLCFFFMCFTYKPGIFPDILTDFFGRSFPVKIRRAGVDTTSETLFPHQKIAPKFRAVAAKLQVCRVFRPNFRDFLIFCRHFRRISGGVRHRLHFLANFGAFSLTFGVTCGDFWPKFAVRDAEKHSGATAGEPTHSLPTCRRGYFSRQILDLIFRG
jgi:hypothetical protein